MADFIVKKDSGSKELIRKTIGLENEKGEVVNHDLVINKKDATKIYFATEKGGLELVNTLKEMFGFMENLEDDIVLSIGGYIAGEISKLPKRALL